MTWRDQITQQSHAGVALQGAFRGVPFIVPSSDAVIGRRTELHEYPLRDIPYPEDLGRKAREFTLEVFVDGKLTSDGNYLAARDALIGAIEAAGPGTLVHPWYGSMQVTVTSARVRESTREGGRATFSLTIIEAGELKFPSSSTSTVTGVQDAADDALSSASDAFAELWSVDGLPDWGITELEADVYATLADLEALVGDVAGDIAALIRTPANMAAAITGAIQRISESAQEPLRAIQLYSRLFDSGDDTSVPTTAAARRQQARSSAALHRLTRQSAVIAACRSSSQTAYATRDDALATSVIVLDALDVQMEATDPVSGAPIDDNIYQSLATLRTQVSNDLRTRGARLPDLMTVTPAVTLPALVLAHQIYGDATRDAEIVARNKIRHPGFVAGGRALEVLSV